MKQIKVDYSYTIATAEPDDKRFIVWHAMILIPKQKKKEA